MAATEKDFKKEEKEKEESKQGINAANTINQANGSNHNSNPSSENFIGKAMLAVHEPGDGLNLERALTTVRDYLAQVAAPLENQDKTQDSNDLIPRAGFHMGPFKDDKGQIVYRGDGRGPSEIFKEGFQREITVTDIVAHIAAEEGGYISASLSKEVAKEYPIHSDIPAGINRTYIYEIHRTKPGIDVAEALAKCGERLDDIEDFKRSQEIAFPENIQSREVKGCWEVDVKKGGEWKGAEKFRQLGYSEEWIESISTEYGRTVNDQFILNPNYKPEGIFAWNNARLMGYGLIAVGATLDGIHFYGEYQQGNPYREIERIAVGWAGAYAMGTWLAGKTALYTSFLSLPIQATCTFTAGVIGSGLGYWGFSTAFMKLYDVRNAQSAMMVKSTKVISTKGLTCTISETEHARIGKCVVDNSLQQAIQKSQISHSIDAKIHDIMSRGWPQNPKEQVQRDRLNKAGGVLGIITAGIRAQQAKAKQAEKMGSSSRSPQSFFSSASNVKNEKATSDSEDKKEMQHDKDNSIVPSSRISRTSDHVDLYLDQLNFHDPGIDRLKNSLANLRDSNNSVSRTSSQAVSPYASSPQQLLQNLEDSKNYVHYSLTESCSYQHSFTQSLPPTYYCGSAAEAAHRTTFFGRCIRGYFMETPPSPTAHNSFGSPSGSYSDHGGKSGYSPCFGNFCSDRSDCGDSGSTICKSNL